VRLKYSHSSLASLISSGVDGVESSGVEGLGGVSPVAFEARA